MAGVLILVVLSLLTFAFYKFKQLLKLTDDCLEPKQEVSENVIHFDFGKNGLLRDCQELLEESVGLDLRIANGEAVIIESIAHSKKRDQVIQRIKRLKD
ncbi:hypothetical protein [Pseudoalteromonas maricaloris]|uniref:hypothetical protein n=1 Tax=Pseudoalteromonas maricaloris TaxID=184924 RepID=UPI00057C3A0B|nr:hypothetical protein [Pseudoalteromonas flavipulchra]KID38062.1 hypothetical protein QT15_04660 [Pseudoalteromonas flavipulchra NCIMB 2033 = ATCC BAA-314]MBD0782769.1 hypothetical protein [Pseudoalteromonas flavipulchra]MBE0372357.1 hypothetical protein [Pseudoalteromonas flavipulchra NCIMB 2033 = ATCC BAA-314]